MQDRVFVVFFSRGEKRMHLRTLCGTRPNQYPLTSKLLCFLARQRLGNRVSITSGSLSIGTIRRTSASFTSPALVCKKQGSARTYGPIEGRSCVVLAFIHFFSSSFLVRQIFSTYAAVSFQFATQFTIRVPILSGVQLHLSADSSALLSCDHLSHTKNVCSALSCKLSQ